MRLDAPLFVAYGVVELWSKNAVARQSQRFIRRSWHNVGVTHCSGSSQRRNEIEELGPCEGKVEGGREQTQHVCRDHQYPQALHMCIDMYVGVCVCVCVCVYICLCVRMLDLRNRQVYM